MLQNLPKEILHIILGYLPNINGYYDAKNVYSLALTTKSIYDLLMPIKIPVIVDLASLKLHIDHAVFKQIAGPIKYKNGQLNYVLYLSLMKIPVNMDKLKAGILTLRIFECYLCDVLYRTERNCEDCIHMNWEVGCYMGSPIVSDLCCDCALKHTKAFGYSHTSVCKDHLFINTSLFENNLYNHIDIDNYYKQHDKNFDIYYCSKCNYCICKCDNCVNYKINSHHDQPLPYSLCEFDKCLPCYFEDLRIARGQIDRCWKCREQKPLQDTCPYIEGPLICNCKYRLCYDCA